jgi:hypothetical protein
MEPEGSLSCLQEPATGSYPDPDESSPQPPQVVPKNPKSEALCNIS